jgi:transcription initiation factor TFIIB
MVTYRMTRCCIVSKQAVTVRCPECGSTNIIVDSDMGEYVCGNCGLVIQEDVPTQGAEWRAFTPQERASRARAGTPTKYSHYDKGLSTVIRVEKDAYGRPLSPKVKQQMWRLRRWQMRSRVHASQSRNLMLAMSELQRLSEILHIPNSVQDMASIVYRKTLNEGLVRGRSQKEIARSYGVVVRNLEMKMPIDDPTDYVTKIAEKAKVSSEVEGLAIKLIERAKKKFATTGKDPSGLAAAALYISAKMLKEKITQSRLAKAADVTEVTVRNRKRDLMKSLKLKKL